MIFLQKQNDTVIAVHTNKMQKEASSNRNIAIKWLSLEKQLKIAEDKIKALNKSSKNSETKRYALVKQLIGVIEVNLNEHQQNSTNENIGFSHNINNLINELSQVWHY